MHEQVQHYYGNVLQGSADLKTDACCTAAAPPPHLRAALGEVHEEVRGRYYGCGLVVPPLLEGMSVLDLGCGAGQDCYVLAQLVGPNGSVVGVDMTAEQLAVAERHRAWHAERFGYANVEFRHGYIERLGELGLADASFDLIVSNCVINLVPDKAAVLREARRLLKPGGELYFSDVYADRRVPAELAADPVLYGECLGGALYWNDFLRLARAAGFTDPRLVEDRPLAITNDAVQAKLGNIRFHSATCRLFKLDGLEPDCEDYGQAVRYRGSVPHHPHQLVLDKHRHIETGRLFPVCGNTWRMLHDTRFAGHFDFFGDFSRHYGLFPGCGGGLPFDGGSASDDAAGCCC
jgi:SAM-dependent methyltransferase